MVYCYGATEILTLNAAGIKNKDFFALTGEFVSDLAKVLNFEKNNDYYLGFDKLGKKLILTIDGKYVELFGTNGLGKAIEKLFSEKKYQSLKEKCLNKVETNGYANKYELNMNNLNVLDLTKGRYTILNWIAILLKFRTFDTNSPISQEAKEYMLKNFYVDVAKYDVIIGYRADDSYFSFAKDFVNNTISVKQLSRAMELGQLGKQVVLISQKSFNELRFNSSKQVDHQTYYTKRVARDKNAKEEYLKNGRTRRSESNELFIMDIIRKGLKDGHTII